MIRRHRSKHFRIEGFLPAGLFMLRPVGGLTRTGHQEVRNHFVRGHQADLRRTIPHQVALTTPLEGFALLDAITSITARNHLRKFFLGLGTIGVEVRLFLLLFQLLRCLLLLLGVTHGPEWSDWRRSIAQLTEVNNGQTTIKSREDIHGLAMFQGERPQ